MTRERKRQGELTQALVQSRKALWVVALVSALLNVLMLAGSIYMMLVYDSVIPSHSLVTLLALFAMVAVMYGFQGLFDMLRGRLLADIGASMDRRIGNRLKQVIDTVTQRKEPGSEPGVDAMRDFDTLRSYLSGPGPAALMDLPWMGIYLLLLTALHVWIGLTTLAGGAVLVALTLYANHRTRQPTEALLRTSNERRAMLDEQQRHGDIIRAMGMGERLWTRWDNKNDQFLSTQADLTRTSGTLSMMSRGFRMFLQSAVLTVGALLVLEGEATGGIIFASSVISSRALGPIDQLIANWKSLASARLSWDRLETLFATFPAAGGASIQLPTPSESLAVEQLALVPPGSQRPVVQNVNFRLEAGDALSIVGMSAAGKSSLARALANIWKPAHGSVKLDGASLQQWDADGLGRHIGYLPQSVELLTGTIAENIARFSDPIDSQAVIAAARAAGVHDMIVALPEGYDTFVGVEGARLSGGQRQRIGLARALYGDPFLVVLDEPNSNLDAAGEEALDRAIQGIRERKGIVVIVAHRAGGLARCNYTLVLKDGQMANFAPTRELFARQAARPQRGSANQMPAITEMQEA